MPAIHMVFRVVCFIAIFSGLGGCAASRSGREFAVENESWRFGGREGTKLTTDHYVIYTTLRDEGLLATFPELMERAFEYYQELVPSTREVAEPMPVFLFASRPEWEAFTKRFTGSRAEVFLQIRNGGYSDRGVTAIQYVSHATTFPLMAHEGLHQYLYHHVNRQPPAWLNEGLAVVCEGQRWSTDGLREFDPWYNPVRRNILAEAVSRGDVYTVAELLETHAGRVVTETSRRVATYYAQVWALVQFLREGEGGKYAAGFAKLCRNLGAPDLEQHAKAANIWSDREKYNYGEALFRAFITDDLAAVEREYLAFLKSRMMQRR